MPSNKEIKGATEVNYHDFDRKLLAETAILENWFSEKVFLERKLSIGSEVEFFILDKNYRPVPDSLKFMQMINKDYLVSELGAAQLEINPDFFDFSGDCLSKMHDNILKYWRCLCERAREKNYHLALIGSLPTATKKHTKPEFVSDIPRYNLMNACAIEHRYGQAINIDIEGVERLTFHPGSIALNGLVSAFQTHMQIGLSQSVRYYNAAQVIAAPVLALSCNSPFLFGKHLWCETRIEIFNQMLTFPRFDRAFGFNSCTFGVNYLKESFFELFDQNAQFFPRLLPETALDLPEEAMFHVRRQNGVVYRWNRPVIDFNELEQPHLRIEHRGPSSGPTVVDMMANAAFYYGILNYFAVQSSPIEDQLPFEHARNNFFKAAQKGLDAKFRWFLGEEISANNLIKNLIPLARQGLKIFNIHGADINYYLELIERRIHLKTNGSDWQCRFIKKYGKDFHNMMAVYLENQYQELPISEWKI